MLKRLLVAFIALHGFLIHGQCDVAITNVNLETYEVTVEVINSLGCTANGPGGVNGKVTQLQIGYHLPEAINADNEVVDLLTIPNAPCSPQWVDNGYNLGMSENSNHVGWWYSPSTSVTFNSDIMGEGLQSGDEVVIPLNPPGDYVTYPYPLAECGDDLIDYWLSEDECIEFVVWQLNYGATWYMDNGGWADGDWAPGTYQDQNCNNSWYLCRDENPNHPVASPDIECLPTAPDAIVNNIEIQTGCVGDLPVYSVEYTVINIGEEPITEYCVELWNEDYYQCFDSDLFGNYEIPPGEGQLFTTQFFEFTGNPGGFFVVSVDNVNDEIITGNNNTTVYYPDEWEECPIECEPDTVEVLTYIYQIDSIFTTIYETDTLFVELPNDTIIEYVDNFITDTLFVETTDTVYVDVEVYVEVFITDTIYEVEYITEYVTDTLYITTVDTVEVIVYEFLTDTVYEYITIDCETGLECIDDPGLTCPDWTSVYLPNTFTPNNDGLNDTWQMVYDLDCWVDVEFKIFNRWGGMIYSGMGDNYDSYPYWDGSVNGGSHYASDGVYTYTFYARKLNSTEVFQRHGHITIFR